jgi:hypothetical protein
MTVRPLLLAAAAVQLFGLVRPALGTVMYLRSRDLLASQRHAVIAAIGEASA